MRRAPCPVPWPHACAACRLGPCRLGPCRLGPMVMRDAALQRLRRRCTRRQPHCRAPHPARSFAQQPAARAPLDVPPHVFAVEGDGHGGPGGDAGGEGGDDNFGAQGRPGAAGSVKAQDGAVELRLRHHLEGQVWHVPGAEGQGSCEGDLQGGWTGGVGRAGRNVQGSSPGILMAGCRLADRPRRLRGTAWNSLNVGDHEGDGGTSCSGGLPCMPPISGDGCRASWPAGGIPRTCPQAQDRLAHACDNRSAAVRQAKRSPSAASAPAPAAQDPQAGPTCSS